MNAWFKKIDIQWESSASYTSKQNDVIEKRMYTIVNSLRVVHKVFEILMRLWDLIIEEIVHTWNRIVTSSNSRDEKITSFEFVNDEKSNVSHLRALDCRVYMHVSKTTMRHKFDDRSWKDVLVEYESINQWKVYNSRIKRVTLTRDARFDEIDNYYEIDNESSECVEESEDDDDEKLENFWTSEDDKYIQKLLKKHSSMRDKSASQYFTSNSSTSRFNIDNDADVEKKKLDSRHDTSSSSMSSSSIFESTMSSSRVSKRLRESIRELVFDENENDFSTSSSTSEGEFDAEIKKRNKVSLSSSSNRQTRSNTRGESRVDYRNLNERKSTKFNDETHYMNRVLMTLFNDETLDLAVRDNEILESQTYKQTRNSSEWSKWKKITKTKLVSHTENDIWTLVKRSSDRKIITERWVFKLKHDFDDKILRYKTRWVVHDYKQLEEVDFSVTWAKVIKSTLFRTLFAIVVVRDLQILQMNVVTVFLYDYLKKNVYIN